MEREFLTTMPGTQIQWEAKFKRRRWWHLRPVDFWGQSRRQVLNRRLAALEAHIQDLDRRLTVMYGDHLREFHAGQDGIVKEPET